MFGVLAAWTLLIIAVPFLGFSFRAPDAATAIQTVGAVVSVLASALAYLRFSLTRRRVYIFVAVAFAVLATNQLVFGVIVRSGPDDIETNSYLWLLGRLITAAFLLVGATDPIHERPRDRPAFWQFARLLAVGLGVLLSGQIAILVARDSLPALVAGSIRLPDLHGVMPGITLVDVVLGLLGAAGFLVAAVAYLRAEAGAFSSWLPPALTIAAFSHVHYMLVPTVYSAWISTGDLLRVAFASSLLVGLILDVRSTYIAELDRRRELDAAYRAEVERVAELEEADRGRAQLLSLITHELLHPVAAIRGNVLVLARRWDAVGEHVRREVVDRLEVDTRQLVELAERIPSAGGLERSPFTVRPQDRAVGRIIRDALPLVRSERPLEVDLDDGVDATIVRVDPVRIAQVFRNLLSNAEKFSPPDGRVRISAWRQADEVCFTVADSGPGVDPGEAVYLFDAFRRGSNVDGNVPGSGLGLYVARGIVEAHGGRIWVEPNAGPGSAFTFTIPCADGER